MKNNKEMSVSEWLVYFSALLTRRRHILWLLFLLPGFVFANPPGEQVTRGELHLHTQNATGVIAASQLHTGVEMSIGGLLGRVQVRQSFRNPSEDWVEGIYVFPLPEDAAVDHLRMWIGDRFIEGDIMEKSAAKKTYEAAKKEGKRATLLEQQRANIFTTHVANIPPGSTIIVEIEYQQQVRYEAGEFSIRFPMVVAPRYIPGKIIEPEYGNFSGKGWARNTDQVTDASSITPPVVDDAEKKINPVEISITLAPGFDLAYLESSYHQVLIQEIDARQRKIELQQGAVAADRDFELRWAALPGNSPQAAMFYEDRDDGHYRMLMLMPPTIDTRVVQPRELILVVDTSGSMHGDSMAQAKQALKIAVSQLTGQDRFNIIQFDSTTSSLYRFSVDADASNLAEAREYIDSLEADGGTEMYPALQLALTQNFDPDYLRQIVFLTDGSVGNEEALFELIAQQLGDSRLFTVGIGSAPNSYFMTRAADFGRGSFTYIGEVREVQSRMDALFTKLSSPALTDISVNWDGWEVQQWPARIPDLYRGEPIILTTRSAHPPATVSLQGNIGGQPWDRKIDLQGGSEATGIHVLWARSQIKHLMAEAVISGNETETREQILAVALEHHLVSKYTSLVAVDKTPVRPVDVSLDSKAMPTNMPKGWSAAKLYGRLPQTATPAGLYLIFGMMALLLIIIVAPRRRAV